jgi:hypothetical protein
MRYLLVVLLTLTLVASAQSGCNVQDFYATAMMLHNPSERHYNLSRWLYFNGEKCNKEQLLIIWNNLPQWAGTSDSAEIRQKITLLYQILMSKETK